MNNSATSNTPWPTVKLGDVCEVARGGSPRPIKNYITTDSNGLNWIKIGDVSPNGKYIEKTSEKIKPSGLNKTRKVFMGDFLLSNSMSFGRPYILKIDGCIHDGWLVLKGFKKVLDENFFYYLLKSDVVQVQFELHAHGSTVRNLNTKSVEDVIIPLPSLDEQQAIVAKVEKGSGEADALAAHFKRLAVLADETFKAELDETFQSLSAPTVKLGDVCEVVSVRGHQIKQNEIKATGRYPVVSQSENKIEGYSDISIAISDVPLILFGDHTCCVKLIDFPFIVGADGTKLLRPITMTLSYMFYCLQNVREKLCDGKYRRHFSDLMATMVPLPPLAEQERIVEKLEAVKVRCERLKAEAERGLKAAEALRKAVLAEAFEQ